MFLQKNHFRLFPKTTTVKHAVFKLFMKQALECVLDFCRNTLAVLHNRYFFHTSFQIFETSLAFILKQPVLYM